MDPALIPGPGGGEPSTIDQDWTYRSGGVDVTAAYRLDSASDISDWYSIADDGYNAASIDHTIKVAPNGSIKFAVPAGRTVSDMVGDFGNVGIMGDQFGNNSDIWMQGRWYFDSKMQTNNWTNNWKLFSLYMNTVPCQEMDITMVRPRSDQTMYRDCGSRDIKTGLSSAIAVGSTPPYYSQMDWNIATGGTVRQPNGIQSQYPNVNWTIPTNKWITLMCHVHIATLGGSGNQSYIELMEHESGRDYWFYVIAWKGNLVYTNNSNDYFNTCLINTFMTSGGGSGIQATQWNLNELIFSGSEIPMPSVAY